MPTTDQLEAIAEHIKYEVDEFRKSIRDLTRLRPGDTAWNRTLESALLHFRILRTFFFDERRYTDDISARHYIEEWQPTKDNVFDETKEALDKRLAHLTLDRLKPPEKWPLGRMNAAIERLVLNFKRSLAQSQADWFSRLEAQTVITSGTEASNRTDSAS